jgi:hypothetical protein
MKSVLVIDTPENCNDCPLCIHTAEEKRYIGYCNTSDEDYYCKALDRFMEYDKVDGGVDILVKPEDCSLKNLPQMRPCNYYDFEHYNSGYDKGWNDCIEHILPKEKEKENDTNDDG